MSAFKVPGASCRLTDLDVQGFKLFFRVTWEPFVAQFSSIEARFSNHTTTVARLASADFQHRALEYQSTKGTYKLHF